MQETNVHEQDFMLTSCFIDCKSQLSPQHLLLLMQEVAWGHVEKHGIGWDYLCQFNQFWALTRLHVKIIRMPQWKETITLKTWGKLSEGLTHFRDHEMVDKDENVIVAATSTWVILDFTTGRPQKALHLPTHLYVNEHKNAIVENAPKIKSISFPEDKHEYKPVLHSDIDVNQHVNNSKYLQFAIDTLPFDYVRKHTLKEFYLNFTRQAKLGDAYSVQYEEVEKDNFITNIYLKAGNVELAKVQTVWESFEKRA